MADVPLLAEADDHFHDECGVFGIFGRQDAAAICKGHDRSVVSSHRLAADRQRLACQRLRRGIGAGLGRRHGGDRPGRQLRAVDRGKQRFLVSQPGRMQPAAGARKGLVNASIEDVLIPIVSVDGNQQREP